MISISADEAKNLSSVDGYMTVWSETQKDASNAIREAARSRLRCVRLRNVKDIDSMLEELSHQGFTVERIDNVVRVSW